MRHKSTVNFRNINYYKPYFNYIFNVTNLKNDFFPPPKKIFLDKKELLKIPLEILGFFRGMLNSVDGRNIIREP